MLYDAKNGNVKVGDTDMDYICFGRGKDILIMLPGLGDGLITAKGKAAVFAVMYRMYAKRYTVFVFSRKNRLEKGCSTRDMAKDQAEAMKALGIKNAYVLGISQGGMIAQYLAIDYPQLVRKLVLTVTLAKQNETIRQAIDTWVHMAQQGAYRELMIDTAEKSYSEGYLKKHRYLYPILGSIGKPKDFGRFLIQAASCTGHDAYAELDQILCPVLVIGGDSDQIVGSSAFAELADRIAHSERYLYRGLGHAVYEEAKDFHKRVMDFLG